MQYELLLHLDVEPANTSLYEGRKIDLTTTALKMVLHMI